MKVDSVQSLRGGLQRWRFAQQARIVLPALVLMALHFLAAQSDALSLYQVGNSLTWDTQPNRTVMIASENSETLDIGYHIHCNSTLTDILASPGSTCVPANSTGEFSDALPMLEWDAVTLQLYNKGATTLADDLQAVTTLYNLTRSNPANASTQFFIHAPWPTLPNWSGWDDPVTASPSQPTKHSLAYFDLFMNEVDTLYPGEFKLIPLGEIIASIRDDIANGTAVGLTSIDDLYRDDVHMSGLGRFVASTAVYASVFATDPTGTPVPRSTGGWSVEDLPDDQAAYLQDAIWDVIKNQPWTGIGPFPDGDLNSDGVVDMADFAAWQTNFGSNTALFADANENRIVDGADYTLWRDAYEAGLAAATPEPSSLWLLAAALPIIATRGRARS